MQGLTQAADKVAINKAERMAAWPMVATRLIRNDFSLILDWMRK
jgi:hypothetical protein